MSKPATPSMPPTFGRAGLRPAVAAAGLREGTERTSSLTRPHTSQGTEPPSRTATRTAPASGVCLSPFIALSPHAPHAARFASHESLEWAEPPLASNSFNPSQHGHLHFCTPRVLTRLTDPWEIGHPRPMKPKRHHVLRERSLRLADAALQACMIDRERIPRSYFIYQSEFLGGLCPKGQGSGKVQVRGGT